MKASLPRRTARVVCSSERLVTKRSLLSWTAAASAAWVGLPLCAAQPAHAALVQFPASSLHNRYILVRVGWLCVLSLPNHPRATEADSTVVPLATMGQDVSRGSACSAQAKPADKIFETPLHHAYVRACVHSACRCGLARAMQKTKAPPSPTQCGRHR